MSGTKVAVVTGSNKGIGFGIVRGLCKQWSGDVYLTSRDEGRGKQAVADLEKEGLSPKFHQLDIDSTESIERLKQFLLDKYGGLDILVNNAGIAYKGNSTAPFAEQAEVSMKTNFWSTLNACNILFPILRPHARVANVSSFTSKTCLGRLSPELKKAVLDCKTIDDIGKLMSQFVNDAKAGDHKQKGWPEWGYGMTKLGVTAMSIIQQADMDKDPREDIVINAICPGYVDTDMTSHKGTKTIDQGADTPIYVVLLPPNVDSPRGKFVSERKVQAWE